MAREMQPPLAPSQLAAQKYDEVQNYDELIAAGIGEHIPIMTLLVHGEKPEEEISEIDFGRAALAAFFAELPAHAPPVDMVGKANTSPSGHATYTSMTQTQAEGAGDLTEEQKNVWSLQEPEEVH